MINRIDIYVFTERIGTVHKYVSTFFENIHYVERLVKVILVVFEKVFKELLRIDVNSGF